MECGFPEFCYQLLFDPRSKPLIHSQITIITSVSLHQLLKKCSQEEKTGYRSCLLLSVRFVSYSVMLLIVSQCM